jgi:hypothetical protein
VQHCVDSQVIVTEQGIQTQQTNQTEITEHLVQVTLSELIVLQFAYQFLLVIVQCRLLENFQLFVDIRFGDQSVQNIEDRVDVPHLQGKK